MYFIGDTHGIPPIFKIVDKHKLTNQNLIHVGDLGLGFQEITRDLKNLSILDQMLDETGNTLYVIRGNHDNPIFWDKKNGIFMPKYHNIHLVEDFEIKKIENKNILFAGGAISIDRSVRATEVPYPSWWKNEIYVPNYAKLTQLLNYYANVDMVVTHSAPDFVFPNKFNDLVDTWAEIDNKHYPTKDLKAELTMERQEISGLYKFLKHRNFNISHWFYGHFHQSKQQTHDQTKFICLNINELYNIP